MKTSAAIVAVLLVALSAGAATLISEPRAMTPAEEAAAATMAHYLAGGAEAVYAELSSTAPLRALAHADAIAEIETRLGPRNGAKWHLDTAMPSLAEHAAVFSVEFPSGVDDAIRLEMTRDGGNWRVKSISTLAEPVAVPTISRAPAAASSEPAPGDSNADHRLAIALVLPALALAVGGAALSGRCTAISRIALAVAAAAVIGGTVYAVKPAIRAKMSPAPVSTKQANVAASRQLNLERLSALLPLRNALAGGDPPPAALHLPEGAARDVQDIWTAQLLARTDRVADARRILNRFPRHTSIPLVELLRARVALEQKKDIDAVSSYERAIDLGPGRDALLYEAAEALSMLGFDERGERYLRGAADMGSRSPTVFYQMAILSVIDRDETRADLYLTKAWQMQPVERASLFGIAPLWYVIRQADFQKLLQPHLAAEPAFATKPSVRPMVVDPSARALVMGDDLQFVFASGELDIPGGSSIAPANATVIDAATWQNEQEQAALADFAPLRGELHSAADMLQPRIRQRAIKTADALASRNRWADLVALTDVFPPSDERVPVDLTILRGVAFSRLGRQDAVRDVIINLLHNPVVKRKRDPGAMVAIAELLSMVGEYDGAVALLNRAQKTVELPGLNQRIEQLSLEKKLASSFDSIPFEHFDVRYSAETPREHAEKIGAILESEYKRLKTSSFPLGLSQRCTVDVLSWEDFKDYTGSESIGGLYTTKIMLPLGNVPVFPPEIVAIMTHELTHALIAEATGRLAPRWFHEALATRMEMNEEAQNAFQVYRDERFLTVALLDAVAGGSPDPHLVVEAYQIGATTLRFIEAKYGKAAIAKMMAAFRNGATTEEAVRAGTGGSVADLDRLARAWGAAQPALFIGQVIHYDGEQPKPNSGWGDN